MNMSHEPVVQTSSKLLCMLPVAVIRSSSDGTVVRYVTVFVILVIMLCCYIMGRVATCDAVTAALLQCAYRLTPLLGGVGRIVS